MNYKSIFFLIIFFEFSSCLTFDRDIKNSEINFKESNCSSEEIEYFFNMILRENLQSHGNFDFFRLYELPRLITDSKGEVLTATLTRYQGNIEVYDCIFIKLKSDTDINCFVQRRGHPEVTRLFKTEELFNWLKYVLHQDKQESICIIS